MANSDLISNDPIVARNFSLDIDGEPSLPLTGISGYSIEMEVVSVDQNTPNGQIHLKTLGGTIKAPTITVKRITPLDAASDPVWSWFNSIRVGGMKAKSRATYRKSCSIFLYDSAYEIVGEFVLTNAWPSKIESDEVSTSAQEAMKETITFECERLDRTM